MESVAAGEFVEYTDGTSVFEGYVVHAANQDSPRACVLIAHDWSGLNEPVRLIAERIAALGYTAFALDVYGKGVRGSPTGDNAHLMNPLVADRSLLRRRLLAGIVAARAHELVDQDRIGVLGYCFGGLCALDLGRAAPPGLKSVVSVHGILSPPNLGEQGDIPASILILHGWEDPYARPPAVMAIADELTQAGADWQIHAYGHAQHVFTFPAANMPERGIVYNATADRRSWDTMVAFLRETLA